MDSKNSDKKQVYVVKAWHYSTPGLIETVCENLLEAKKIALSYANLIRADMGLPAIGLIDFNADHDVYKRAIKAVRMANDCQMAGVASQSDDEYLSCNVIIEEMLLVTSEVFSKMAFDDEGELPSRPTDDGDDLDMILFSHGEHLENGRGWWSATAGWVSSPHEATRFTADEAALLDVPPSKNNDANFRPVSAIDGLASSQGVKPEQAAPSMEP